YLDLRKVVPASAKVAARIMKAHEIPAHLSRSRPGQADILLANEPETQAVLRLHTQYAVKEATSLLETLVEETDWNTSGEVDLMIRKYLKATEAGVVAESLENLARLRDVFHKLKRAAFYKKFCP